MQKTTITLGGVALTLGPLLAKSIRENKEKIRLARLGQIAPEDMIEHVVDLATACAQRVDGAVTREQVEDLVDMGNMGQVLGAVWGVSVPEPMPGETQAAVNPPT